jgi:hypothetical protein
VDVEEEEEDGDEEKRVHKGLRHLGGRNSEEADIRGQGNSGAGRGGYRQPSDQGSARPGRLTSNSGMDIDMDIVGEVDGAGVAQQVEPLERAGKRDENPSTMDVDVDKVGITKRGEQSGAADVDMGVGSMNEHDKAPSKATPESSPSRTPSPSNKKDSPIAGEKRKNPT